MMFFLKDAERIPLGGERTALIISQALKPQPGMSERHDSIPAYTQQPCELLGCFSASMEAFSPVPEHQDHC